MHRLFEEKGCNPEHKFIKYEIVKFVHLRNENFWTAQESHTCQHTGKGENYYLEYKSDSKCVINLVTNIRLLSND